MQLENVSVPANVVGAHLLPVELHALAPDLAEFEVVGDLAVHLQSETVRRARARSGRIPSSRVLAEALARTASETRINAVWGDRDVIAARGVVGLGLGDLTCNQQFIVGGRQDIRGYTQGEFRGNYMVAVQGEYRWNLATRWGLVGFLGVARFHRYSPWTATM